MRSIDHLSLSPNPHFAAIFGAAPTKEEAQCHVHFLFVGALRWNLGFASISAEAFVRVHSVGQGSVRLPCFFFFFSAELRPPVAPDCHVKSCLAARVLHSSRACA